MNKFLVAAPTLQDKRFFVSTDKEVALGQHEKPVSMEFVDREGSVIQRVVARFRPYIDAMHENEQMPLCQLIVVSEIVAENPPEGAFIQAIAV